jgi:hypothetical protein
MNSFTVFKVIKSADDNIDANIMYCVLSADKRCRVIDVVGINGDVHPATRLHSLGLPSPYIEYTDGLQAIISAWSKMQNAMTINEFIKTMDVTNMYYT